MFEILYSRGKICQVRVSENDLPFEHAPILWNASQHLLKSLKTGSPGLPWTHQLKSLRNEFDVLIQSISPRDDLAKLVLRTIPHEVRERGIFPEEALKSRFNQLEKIARRIELVPIGGAPLITYILSYAQSMLLFKTVSYIPQTELNDEHTDFTKMTTDDIFVRARFFLERDDFVQALKYMNLLKGACRVVARQWMNEVRMLLETRQAAQILMAHATSCSFRYV
ncbi:hypothetical protein ABEB36_009656 [Hypothenemus hampei]|uniref:MICOS complex subunit MIC60 n=1 Tax=Hypothenemus hampei TaxID=57062 RepID=A0ABD1EH42_HYPHA